MRRGAIAILLLGAGCRQLLGIDDPTVGSGSLDAATSDALVDTPSGVVCVGAPPYRVCMSEPGPLVLSDNTTIDTTSDARCTPPASAPGWVSTTQPQACFIVGTDISIGSLKASGSRPLVIVATETLIVTGVIDVASHRIGSVQGPGAPWSGCAAFPVTAGASTLGAGGGAGASFGGAGGTGGQGGFAGGGMAPPAGAAPTVLRAGCTGQTGGAGTSSATLGGGGGGAIYLAAGTSMTFKGSGSINASGAGGYPTAPHGGGGGGGSGGMIVLFGQTIEMVTGARIVANGGGGAGGAQLGSGGAGQEANPTTGLGGGVGGPGTGSGGNGGEGGSVSVVAQNGTAASGDGGGGGGGGSVGYIQANHPLTGMASPAPAIVP
jgi:hypothetical protein